MSDSQSISSHASVYRRSRSYSNRNSVSKRRTKKEANTKPNIILSVLFGIIAVAFMCAFITLMIFRTANITRTAKDVIRDLDIAMILQNFDVDYYLLNQINDIPFHDTFIYYTDIDEFFKEDNVAAEFGIVADRYLRAFAAGDLDYHITADDVVNHAFNIEPELHALFDLTMTHEDYEELAMIIDDVLDLSSLSISGLAEDFELDMTVPAYIMSPVVFLIVGLISAGLLILILFLNKNNPPAAFLTIGITFLVSGLTVFIAGLWLDASLESLSESINHMILHIGDIANHTSQYGFIFAAIGVLITVISYSVLRLPHNRNSTNNHGGIR